MRYATEGLIKLQYILSNGGVEALNMDDIEEIATFLARANGEILMNKKIICKEARV